MQLSNFQPEDRDDASEHQSQVTRLHISHKASYRSSGFRGSFTVDDKMTVSEINFKIYLPTLPLIVPGITYSTSHRRTNPETYNDLHYTFSNFLSDYCSEVNK